MSAAHSNTHQSPYSSSRGGKYSRASAASSSSAEESAEFKALRSKYSSILKTLHEMFPDWTDADLLYAIQEADGNLETTIAHIAEGFAPQWGEVKSRKDKRQAAKHHQDDSRPFEKTSYVPRPASFRGGVRGGAARGGRGGYSHAPSTRGKPAPAASAKAPAPASNADNSAAGWDAEPADTKSSGAWGAGPAVSDSKPKEPASAPAPAASTPAKPAPMSWASIAKRGAQHVAPEPAQPAEPAQKTAESAQEEPQKPPKEETKPEANTAEAVLEEKPESDEVAAAPAAEAETQETGTEELQSASAAAAKRPVSNSRRLNQDAPVVMPSGNATLERIGMQFGSLSIGGVELNTPRTAAAAASAIVSAAPGPDKPAVEAIAPQTEVKEPAAAAPAPAPVQAPAKAEAATTIPETTPAASQGPLTTYLQQQQQQQQHSQTQAQASASASASAISQMPLPNDYGAAALYGSDAQRNNMMGFYDNYGYGQFVANKDDASAAASAAGSQPSATGAHQAVGVNGTSNLSQAGLFPQQIPQPFSMNPGLPYYNPYYYNMMQPGSQFPNPAAFGNNPALAAAYGQPFMKQGMYPMYPGATPQGLQSTVGSHNQQLASSRPASSSSSSLASSLLSVLRATLARMET
ncbi:hypothetical protein GQ54DRAFT_59498 [Martensiomyces pterosporus]|nr:hypothetical protein GQ54DRAFT_59498 [Martensiomyces pterosporus]